MFLEFGSKTDLNLNLKSTEPKFNLGGVSYPNLVLLPANGVTAPCTLFAYSTDCYYFNEDIND